MSNIFLKFFSNDRDPTNAENTQKKNKALLFVGLFVTMGLLLIMATSSEEPRKVGIGSFSIVEEGDMAKTKWVGDAAIDLKIAKRRVDKLDVKNQKLREELSALKKIVTNMKNRQDKTYLKNQQDEKNQDQSGNKSPLFLNKNGINKGLYANYPSKPIEVGENQTQNLGINQIGEIPTVEKKDVITYTRLEQSLVYKQFAKTNKKTNKKNKAKKSENIISTGSITKAILISGVDAPTMTQAKTSPLPILMKVTDLSILPNNWKYDIKECFLTGEGYGDLTSERAYIRTNNISCVTNNSKHIDMPFKGVVTGEDGKLGLKGRVVTKQGALLARTLISNFLQGIGNAFSEQDQIIFTGPNGTTSTTKSLNLLERMQSASFKGISKTTEKLADFYLKMADQISPVIEISAGREVDIMTTSMAKLETIEK